MISGWCLAEDKSKMSKSKGNIVDPDYLINKLLDIWKNDPINNLRTMLRNLDNEYLEFDNETQKLLNKSFTARDIAAITGQQAARAARAPRAATARATARDQSRIC